MWWSCLNTMIHCRKSSKNRMMCTCHHGWIITHRWDVPTFRETWNRKKDNWFFVFTLHLIEDEKRSLIKKILFKVRTRICLIFRLRYCWWKVVIKCRKAYQKRHFGCYFLTSMPPSWRIQLVGTAFYSHFKEKKIYLRIFNKYS